MASKRKSIARPAKPPLQEKLAAELETTNERTFEVLLLTRGPGLNATARKQLLVDLKSVNQSLKAIAKRFGAIADAASLEKAGWTRSKSGWSHPEGDGYYDTSDALDLQEWLEESAERLRSAGWTQKRSATSANWFSPSDGRAYTIDDAIAILDELEARK